MLNEEESLDSALNNLSELLLMKDPEKYTTVERSLYRMLDWYFRTNDER